ncbi:hypothetical protein GCM10009560_75570 [Nonomuraea longicatena]|uniref:Uncharacterized protein n=1 Tax=Nonomuraea longicatena TaxID=83682 RepID=A0ABP4BPL1_9ACTN
MSGVALDFRRLAARQTDAVREPCFTREGPPLAMGCAVCGHPPYAHGCSSVGAHEYEVPSAVLMAERLHLYTALGLHRRRMSVAEFRREHVCAPAPEQVASELEAVQVEAEPFDGLDTAATVTAPDVEVAAARHTMPRSAEPPAPSRDGVDRIAVSPLRSGGRRRPVLRRPWADRSGAFPRAGRLQAATRVHAPDMPPRWRSRRGRTFRRIGLSRSDGISGNGSQSRERSPGDGRHRTAAECPHPGVAPHARGRGDGPSRGPRRA